MKLDINTKVKPFKSEVVERPWGIYKLYSSNEKCTTKILFVKKGETLSLQYHLMRSQLYEIIDGPFEIQYSTEPVPMSFVEMPDNEIKFQVLEDFLTRHLITEIANEGDLYGFQQRIIHRAKYLGEREYGRFLDLAWGKNSEDDVYRIRDEYSRENIKG